MQVELSDKVLEALRVGEPKPKSRGGRQLPTWALLEAGKAFGLLPSSAKGFDDSTNAKVHTVQGLQYVGDLHNAIIDMLDCYFPGWRGYEVRYLTARHLGRNGHG